MRILTLVAGVESLDDAVRLTDEIRTFNAGIDFRLRFLHIEIEQVHAVPAGLTDRLRGRMDRRGDIHEVPPGAPLDAAARLALVLHRERPQVLVIAGKGPLVEPALAAARAAGTRIAFYGTGRHRGDGALDLGADPNSALEGLTGVARELQS